MRVCCHCLLRCEFEEAVVAEVQAVLAPGLRRRMLPLCEFVCDDDARRVDDTVDAGCDEKCAQVHACFARCVAEHAHVRRDAVVCFDVRDSM